MACRSARCPTVAEHVVILNQTQLEEILSRALDQIRDQLANARLCDDCRINLRAALRAEPTVDLAKPVCTCEQIETTPLDASKRTYARGEPNPDCPVHPDDCCTTCGHPWYVHHTNGCGKCWQVLAPIRCSSPRPHGTL